MVKNKPYAFFCDFANPYSNKMLVVGSKLPILVHRADDGRTNIWEQNDLHRFSTNP